MTGREDPFRAYRVSRKLRLQHREGPGGGLGSAPSWIVACTASTASPESGASSRWRAERADGGSGLRGAVPQSARRAATCRPTVASESRCLSGLTRNQSRSRNPLIDAPFQLALTAPSPAPSAQQRDRNDELEGPSAKRGPPGGHRTPRPGSLMPRGDRTDFLLANSIQPAFGARRARSSED